MHMPSLQLQPAGLAQSLHVTSLHGSAMHIDCTQIWLAGQPNALQSTHVPNRHSSSGPHVTFAHGSTHCSFTHTSFAEHCAHCVGTQKPPPPPLMSHLKPAGHGNSPPAHCTRQPPSTHDVVPGHGALLS